MRELKLSTALRLALVPAFALGVAAASNAQTSATPNPAKTNATTAKSQPANTAYRAMRASKMIGMEVRNPEGKNLGKINDLIVNLTTGDVRYAIMEFDPGIFQGERLFAVPTTQLRMAPDRDDLVYNMTRDKLEMAGVGVDRATWGVRGKRKPLDTAYLANLDKAWGVVQPTAGPRAHRVSDLLGIDVNSRSGEDIGEVEDLVINMATQKVHYAVLEFDPSWTSPEQLYAFPLRAFNQSIDKDELVLDIDKARLKAMKSFTKNQYSNLNDRAWVTDMDRYFVTILPVVVTGSTATAGKTGASNTATTSLSALFANLDDDKNGSLSKTEVKDSADVDRNWTRLDKDGDGKISQSEFMSNYTIEAKK